MQELANFLRFPLKFGCGLVLMIVLTACGAQYRNHGYVPTDEELAEIVIGVDTRETVEETLGRGVFFDVLDRRGTYYLRSRVRMRGILEPKVVERKLIAVTFDDDEVVSNIETYGLSDGREVVLTRRVTESSVSSSGFLRQLLGNLGRFDPENVINQ
ncbi:MAG: outer membrane protein assembly factor BamE [Aestuariivita sp.]|nr:outer membrane protein assembly factor BamE [Aestuariivita sp.]